MSLTQNKLHAARKLIRQERYDQARQILRTIDHPTAREWLLTLDEIAPRRTPHRRHAKNDPAGDLNWLDQINNHEPARQSRRKSLKSADPRKQPGQRDEENDQSLITGMLVLMIFIIGGIMMTAIIATNNPTNRGNISTTGDVTGLNQGFTNYSVQLKHIHSDAIPSRKAGYFCAGYVGDIPDHIVEWPYQGGRLRIRANSPVDTVLLVLAPDGTWYCDDDGSGTMHPQIVFTDAAPGNYHIYVGPYILDDGGAGATIYINWG